MLFFLTELALERVQCCANVSDPTQRLGAGPDIVVATGVVSVYEIGDPDKAFSLPIYLVTF